MILAPHQDQAQTKGLQPVDMEILVPGWPMAIVASSTKELGCRSQLGNHTRGQSISQEVASVDSDPGATEKRLALTPMEPWWGFPKTKDKTNK